MGEDKQEDIGRALRIVAIVSGGLIILLISIAIAVAILSTMNVFEVTNVEADGTEHVKPEDVVQLADVPKGTTLLRFDGEQIEQNVLRNPWVASIEIERVFPDTLRLHAKERKPGAVVSMGTGGIAWLMGDDGVWIEPLKLKVEESESVNDVALKQAASLGVVLISDVPSSVQPDAGTHTTDKSIETVFSIAGQLSEEFRGQVVCYSAASEDDISCILKNGVEVSLGSDSEIRSKEAVAKRILEEYGGQVTYINVRIPSRPTYRRVDSEFVREGTGAMGSAVDKGDEDKSSESSASEGDEAQGAEQSQTPIGDEATTQQDEVSGTDGSYDDNSYSSDGSSYDYGYDGYEYDESWDYSDYSDYSQDYEYSEDYYSDYNSYDYGY